MTPEIAAELQRSIGRLEGKVDMALTLLDKRGEEHASAAKERVEHAEKMDARLSRVERRQYAATAVGGVFGALASFAVALLGVLPK
jgi:hypothetical protein